MAEDWTKEWERQVVNGVYPLHRFLGHSDHSAVFLTECKVPPIAQAAIKILPVDPALADAQLVHLKALTALSHPHLIRVFDAGRCYLGGQPFVFVVMEFAEQNLGQILPGRALTPEEVHELLPPTLDALAYLHHRNLAHNGIKPSNFQVVGDQLKLACDTVRPSGERTSTKTKSSIYDAPEARKSGATTAGDLWRLGITLVEALTQTLPVVSADRADSVALPDDLPPEFVDTIRRCLHRDPAGRPTIIELMTQSVAAPATPAVASMLAPELVPVPVPAPAPVPTLLPTSVPTVAPVLKPIVGIPLVEKPVAYHPVERSKTGLILVATVVGILALWVIWSFIHRAPAPAPTAQTAQTTAAVVDQPPPAVAPPEPAEQPTSSTAALPSSVVHQEVPDLSRRTRDKIHGVIKIPVRVTVDRLGRVIATALDNRGSSKYLAHASLDAAKNWRFSVTDQQAPRTWLIHFEFSHAGATAHAAGQPAT